MALSGWNQDQYIDFVTDPADITEAHENIPVRLVVCATSGKNGANCIGFFTTLGSNWKKVAVEIDGSGESEPVYCGHYSEEENYAEYYVKIKTASTSSPHTIRLYFDETHADNNFVCNKSTTGTYEFTYSYASSSTSRWVNKQNRTRISASILADQTIYRPFVRVGFMGLLNSAVTIGECWVGRAASSGNPYDFDGNQVQVTFNGGNTSLPLPQYTTDRPIWSDPCLPVEWFDGTFDIIVSYSTINDQGFKKLRYTTKSGWTNYSASLASPDESGDTVPGQSYSSDTEVYHFFGIMLDTPGYVVWISYAYAWDFNDDVAGTGSDPFYDAKLKREAILNDSPDNWDGPFLDNQLGRYIRFDGVGRYFDYLMSGTGLYYHTCEFAVRFLTGDEVTTYVQQPGPAASSTGARYLAAGVNDNSGTMQARVIGYSGTYGTSTGNWITYGNSRDDWLYGALRAGNQAKTVSTDHSLIERLTGTEEAVTGTSGAAYIQGPRIGRTYTGTYQKVECAFCRVLPNEKATIAWLKTMALGDGDALFTVSYNGPDVGEIGTINSSLPSMTCQIAASYAEGGNIDAALPSMTCQMADDSFFFGDIGASIPALTCEMYGGRPHYIGASIPAMTGLFIEAGNHIVAELPLMYATFENSHLSGAMALPKMTCRMDAGASLESSLARMEICDAVGYSGYVADISAELPGLEAEGYIGALLGASLPNLACFMFINTGYDVWLAGALPRLTGQLQGQSEVLCGIDAKLTRVTGRLTGNTNGVGNIAAELPALVISDGTVFNGLVGRASSRLPCMKARLAGAVSDVTAIEAEIPAMLIDGVIQSDCGMVLHHVRGAVR